MDISIKQAFSAVLAMALLPLPTFPSAKVSGPVPETVFQTTALAPLNVGAQFWVRPFRLKVPNIPRRMRTIFGGMIAMMSANVAHAAQFKIHRVVTALSDGSMRISTHVDAIVEKPGLHRAADSLTNVQRAMHSIPHVLNQPLQRLPSVSEIYSANKTAIDTAIRHTHHGVGSVPFIQHYVYPGAHLHLPGTDVIQQIPRPIPAPIADFHQYAHDMISQLPPLHVQTLNWLPVVVMTGFTIALLAGLSYGLWRYRVRKRSTPPQKGPSPEIAAAKEVASKPPKADPVQTAPAAQAPVKALMKLQEARSNFCLAGSVKDALTGVDVLTVKPDADLDLFEKAVGAVVVGAGGKSKLRELDRPAYDLMDALQSAIVSAKRLREKSSDAPPAKIEIISKTPVPERTSVVKVEQTKVPGQNGSSREFKRVVVSPQQIIQDLREKKESIQQGIGRGLKFDQDFYFRLAAKKAYFAATLEGLPAGDPHRQKIEALYNEIDDLLSSKVVRVFRKLGRGSRLFSFALIPAAQNKPPNEHVILLAVGGVIALALIIAVWPENFSFRIWCQEHFGPIEGNYDKIRGRETSQLDFEPGSPLGAFQIENFADWLEGWLYKLRIYKQPEPSFIHAMRAHVGPDTSFPPDFNRTFVQERSRRGA